MCSRVRSVHIPTREIEGVIAKQESSITIVWRNGKETSSKDLLLAKAEFLSSIAWREGSSACEQRTIATTCHGKRRNRIEGTTSHLYWTEWCQVAHHKRLTALLPTINRWREGRSASSRIWYSPNQLVKRKEYEENPSYQEWWIGEKEENEE